MRIATFGLLSLLALMGCNNRPVLSFRVLHVAVGHDQFEVLDVALVDPDHDGDLDLVVATDNDLRYLRHERGAWQNGTAGTGLDRVAPVQRLHRLGTSLLAERNGTLVLLSASEIGTWSEQSEGPVPAIEPVVDTELLLDLDGDGNDERVRLAERRLTVESSSPGGDWRDVTALCGADSLLLPAPGRRLLSGDLNGDGQVDLAVVGGRLFVLLGNGGTLAAPRTASLAAGLVGATLPATAPAPRALAVAQTAPAPQEAAIENPAPADDETAPASTADVAWFVDGTTASGLIFTHAEGGEQWDIRPTMGPGACFGDVDGDGDADLCVAGGSDQDNVLFINDGSGRFQDQSKARGLHELPRGAGMGVLFADFENDGDPDLYITRDGRNLLLRNDSGRFTDITGSSRTGDARWGASAAAADSDRDGDLELFVANYLHFDPSVLPPEERRREDPLAMLPYVFKGQANVLYRNDGNLRFTDVSTLVGLTDTGKSLGALFLDQDADGWPDLYVANDTTPNTFHHNLGDGTFEEIALAIGMDDPRGGMGLSAADVDGDSDEDILLTNWQLEPNALYRNNRVYGTTQRRFMPAFEDIAVQAGLAQPSVGYVGWGCLLADLDGDADLDAFVVNGYTSPDYETSMYCVGQTDQLFENVSGTGPFAEQRSTPRWQLVEAERAGTWADRALPSRGLAAADVDGDGDLDLAITANNGPLVFLVNQRGGRFLSVVPDGRAPRDAVGARVVVELEDGRKTTAVVHRGSGYLGGHERGVRVGLGFAKAVAISVTWPDGTLSRHETPPQGRLVVRQP